MQMSTIVPPTTSQSLLVQNEDLRPTAQRSVDVNVQREREGTHVMCVEVKLAMKLPACPSSSSMVSETSSSIVGPTCRICDSPKEASNNLISPCRCSGTAKYVHEQCLNKWLETINSRNSPRCEVCRYRIHTHKTYKLRNWNVPEVSRTDKILHSVFLLSVVLLIASACMTISGFLTEHSVTRDTRHNKAMTADEVSTLVCGILFFLSFIVALTTQIKAKHNIYRLCVMCVVVNTEWKIDSYNKSEDSLFLT